MQVKYQQKYLVSQIRGSELTVIYIYIYIYANNGLMILLSDLCFVMWIAILSFSCLLPVSTRFSFGFIGLWIWWPCYIITHTHTDYICMYVCVCVCAVLPWYYWATQNYRKGNSITATALTQYGPIKSQLLDRHCFFFLFFLVNSYMHNTAILLVFFIIAVEQGPVPWL